MHRDVTDLQRAFTDACNDHDLEAIGRLCDPRVVAERPGHRPVRGVDAFCAWWAEDFAAFPDLTLAPDLVLAQGETVFTECTVRGTNTGPLARCDLPLAPTTTGARIALRASTVDEWRDGRLVASRAYWDHLDLLRQLGLLPALIAGI